jgi:hypothetical protein
LQLVPGELKAPLPVLVKDTLPVGVVAPGEAVSVTVAVQVVGTVTLTGLGLQLTLVDVGWVEFTVSVAAAVFPVKARPPPPVAVIAPVTLFLVPEVVAVTVTESVQEPFAGIVPPLRLTDVAPAAGANVPPHVFVVPGVDATCTPVGKLSVNAAVVRFAALGLLSVKLSVDVPPTRIVFGEKDLLKLGGANTATL